MKYGNLVAESEREMGRLLVVVLLIFLVVLSALLSVS